MATLASAVGPIGERPVGEEHQQRTPRVTVAKYPRPPRIIRDLHGNLHHAGASPTSPGIVGAEKAIVQIVTPARSASGNTKLYPRALLLTLPAVRKVSRPPVRVVRPALRNRAVWRQRPLKAALPSAPYDTKPRRRYFVRRDRNRGELCLAPLCAFAVGADEKVSDCLFRVVADQLRAKPCHRDAAIRTHREI